MSLSADTRDSLCEVEGGYSALSYGSTTSENELPIWVINHEDTREPNEPDGRIMERHPGNDPRRFSLINGHSVLARPNTRPFRAQAPIDETMMGWKCLVLEVARVRLVLGNNKACGDHRADLVMAELRGSQSGKSRIVTHGRKRVLPWLSIKILFDLHSMTSGQ